MKISLKTFSAFYNVKPGNNFITPVKRMKESIFYLKIPSPPHRDQNFFLEGLCLMGS